jgi:hypothetical protein
MTLKKLALSVSLMSILAIAAFGGETLSPPCAPGETNGPPCPGQSVTDGSTDPDELNGLPSPSVDIVTIVEGLQLALSLF